MKPKNYNQIKRWVRRHGGALFTLWPVKESQWVNADDFFLPILTRRGAVKGFDHQQNVSASKHPKPA